MTQTLPRPDSDALGLESIGSVVRKLELVRQSPTQREDARRNAEAEREREELIQREMRRREWAAIAREVGQRYSNVSLENFEIYGSAEEMGRQQSVLVECRQFSQGIVDNSKSGSGVILFGPPGTGKDHLMCSMLLTACLQGLTVKWLNGLDFFGGMRDRMDSSSSEESILRELSQPDILAISDPLPPWGPLTAFQAQTLFRLIDRRYRRQRPIWVTVNVANGAEASDRIGSAVVDRLRERSLSVHCNWPSFRSR